MVKTGRLQGNTSLCTQRVSTDKKPLVISSVWISSNNVVRLSHHERWLHPIIFIWHIKNLWFQGHYLAQGHRTSKPGLLNSVLFISQPLPRKVLDFWRHLDMAKKEEGCVNLCRAERGRETLLPLFPCWDSHLNLHFFHWVGVLDGAAGRNWTGLLESGLSQQCLSSSPEFLCSAPSIASPHPALPVPHKD